MALTTTITIGGNLTADPELHESKTGGKSFVRVSIAVNPREFDRDSREWKDGEPVFWRGTAFGELAEHIAASLAKGQRVIAHGTVKADTWTDKDSGTKRVEKQFLIEDIGPSLMYGNAQPVKGKPKSQDTDDAWAPAQTGDDTPF